MAVHSIAVLDVRGRRLAGLLASGLLRRNVWGLADQALISATNFVTMVLLGRGLGPAAFGAFSLAYAVLLFANSVQTSLITQPHNVLGAPREGDDYTRYTSATAAGQLLFTAAVTALVAAAGPIVQQAGWATAGLLSALALALVPWQLQEFVRRVLYTKSDAAGAFKIDLVSYGSQLLGIAVLWRAGLLTATNAIAVLGLAFALGCAFGLYQLRSHVEWSFSGQRFRGATRANWTFGKWLLAGNLLFWATTQLYPVLVAGVVGVAATGVMRAAQTIMGPTRILLNDLETSFSPKAARAYASGGVPALDAFMRRVYMRTAPPMALYCLGVALFAKPILGLVYGRDYTRYSWILVFIAVATALSYLQKPVRIALRGMEATSSIFHAYVWSTVVFLTLGAGAVYVIGLLGAGLGLVAHPLVVNIVLWRAYRRRVASAGDGGSSPVGVCGARS